MPTASSAAETSDASRNPSESDALLLRRIRLGDHDAFGQVFTAHYALLRAVAQRLTAPEQAEEIVQDIFLSLWERRTALQVDGPLRAYLLSAIRFASASTMRRAQLAANSATRVRALHRAPAPADAAVMNDERARAIEQALSELPTRCRMVFELVRLEGLTYQEAGNTLGIATKTVEAQMGKALKRLRDSLRAFRQP